MTHTFPYVSPMTRLKTALAVLRGEAVVYRVEFTGPTTFRPVVGQSMKIVGNHFIAGGMVRVDSGPLAFPAFWSGRKVYVRGRGFIDGTEEL